MWGTIASVGGSLLSSLLNSKNSGGSSGGAAPSSGGGMSSWLNPLVGLGSQMISADTMQRLANYQMALYHSANAAQQMPQYTTFGPGGSAYGWGAGVGPQFSGFGNLANIASNPTAAATGFGGYGGYGYPGGYTGGGTATTQPVSNMATAQGYDPSQFGVINVQGKHVPGSGGTAGTIGSVGGGLIGGYFGGPAGGMIGSKLGGALLGGLFGSAPKIKYGGTIDPATGTVTIPGQADRSAALTQYLQTGQPPDGRHFGSKVSRLTNQIQDLFNQGYHYSPNSGAAGASGAGAAPSPLGSGASSSSALGPQMNLGSYLSPEYGGLGALAAQQTGLAGQTATGGLPPEVAQAMQAFGNVYGNGIQGTQGPLAGTMFNGLGTANNFLNSTGGDFTNTFNNTYSNLLQQLQDPMQQAWAQMNDQQFQRGQLGTTGGGLQTTAFAKGLGQAMLGAQNQAYNQALGAVNTDLSGANVAGNLGMGAANSIYNQNASTYNDLLNGAMSGFGMAENAAGFPTQLAAQQLGLGSSAIGDANTLNNIGLGNMGMNLNYANDQAANQARMDAILGGLTTSQNFFPANNIRGQTLMNNVANGSIGGILGNLFGGSGSSGGLLGDLGGLFGGSGGGSSGAGSLFGSMGGGWDNSGGLIGGGDPWASFGGSLGSSFGGGG